MEQPNSALDESSQKRKRRPKSYQGCTQCRLARRKCGEGTVLLLLPETTLYCSSASWSTIRAFLSHMFVMLMLFVQSDQLVLSVLKEESNVRYNFLIKKVD